MPVLRAALAGKQHHFLCAHALGVYVGDELKAYVQNAVQSEIGDLNAGLFCVGQDNARLFKIADGLFLTGNHFASFHYAFISHSLVRFFRIS